MRMRSSSRGRARRSLPALAWLIATQRGDLLTAAGLIVGLAFLIALVQPVRTRHVLLLCLLLNSALAWAYFWSLGEAHTVVVQVSPHTLSAAIDGDTATY